MSDTMIKILGIAAISLVCTAVGAVFGIVIAYIILGSKPQYPFGYRLAFIMGIVGGAYGLVNSIREIWLR
jgi:hypothetical protein